MSLPDFSRKALREKTPIPCATGARLCLAVFLCPMFMVAAAVAQVIPAARTFPEAWQNAGHPGGAPVQNRTVNVRDFGAVGDGVANDFLAFTNAITSLGTNAGVVYIPPGNYLIQSAHTNAGGVLVLTNRNGVVLRGHSAAQTTLIFESTGFVRHAVLVQGGISGSWIPFTEAAAIHTNVITISNASTFAAGGYGLLTQDDAAAWNITDTWAQGSAGQVVKIASVNGNQLQLERPLRHDYPLARNPRILRLLPARNSGIENLTLERRLSGATSSDRDNKYTVRFNYAAECWMRGVHSKMTFGSHVSLEFSSGVEITGCVFDDAHEFDGGGSGYGVLLQSRSGGCLVQNNIFRRLRHAMILQSGANGNVLGYNYLREGNSADHPGYATDMCLHGNYSYANLFEGNIGEHIWIDNSHDGANGPFNTFFRNRAEIAGFNMTDSLAHSQNVVGNELYRGGTLAQLVAGNGYRFMGTNHFTHANDSIASGLQPSGTTNLADVSYYLNTNPLVAPPTPAWWDIADPLPTIGRPRTFSATKNNPARNRWFAGGVRTVAAPVPVLSCTNSLTLTQGATSNAVLAITNAGEGTLNWTLTSITYSGAPTNWITSISPTNGLVGTNPANLTITVNRTALGATNSTATLSIQSNGGATQVSVQASAPRYLITTTSGPGGSVAPVNPEVLHGQSVAIDIIPDAWFASSNVLVDEASIGPSARHTFSNVTSARSLHALFSPQMVTNAPVPVPRAWFAQYGITNAMEAANLADLDSDGTASWREFLAATDPTNASSAFRITRVEPGPGGQMIVRFTPSSPDRRYTLQQAGQLGAGPWTNVPGQGPRPGTGGADQMTVSAATNAKGFFRVGVTVP